MKTKCHQEFGWMFCSLQVLAGQSRFGYLRGVFFQLRSTALREVAVLKDRQFQMPRDTMKQGLFHQGLVADR